MRWQSSKDVGSTPTGSTILDRRQSNALLDRGDSARCIAQHAGKPTLAPVPFSVATRHCELLTNHGFPQGRRAAVYFLLAVFWRTFFANLGVRLFSSKQKLLVLRGRVSLVRFQPCLAVAQLVEQCPR